MSGMRSVDIPMTESMSSVLASFADTNDVPEFAVMLFSALLDIACVQLMVGDIQIEPGESSFKLIANLPGGVRTVTINLVTGH